MEDVQFPTAEAVDAMRHLENGAWKWMAGAFEGGSTMGLLADTWYMVVYEAVTRASFRPASPTHGYISEHSPPPGQH